MAASVQTLESNRVGENKVTFDEFLALDGFELPTEWINGKVVALSPVTDRHSDIVSFLTTLLRFASDAAGRGVVRCNSFVMRVSGNANVRAPDILFLNPTIRTGLKRRSWTARPTS